MFDEATPGVLLQAVQFAAHKHQDQRRKDQQATPYINHPIDVAATLWQVGGVRETAILVAALLHDTLEDTATTPEEIRAAFGATVLELVLEVTDDKSLPKAVRKQLQVAHAPQKSPGARAIKLADKIHNVHDVGASPPADWSPQRLRDYLDWTEQVVAGLRGTHPALEARYDAELRQARARLA